jgi:hypothetical protein
MDAPVTGVFHPAFALHHRNTVNSTHLGRVLIERVISRGEWNPVTNLIEGGETLAIYRGPARIQKVAFPTNRDFVEDAAKFQRMRIALGFDENELTPRSFDINVNDRVTVLANASDPEKVGDIYYVHGDESSSNAWERVLTAQNNMKQA